MLTFDVEEPRASCLAAKTIYDELVSHDSLPDSEPKSALFTLLSFSLSDWTDCQRLSSLLSKRMPFLEELSITFNHHVADQFISFFMPTLDLQLSLYPSLRKLRLVGVSINVSLLASQSLRHLCLQNHTGPDGSVLFTQFMATVEAFPQLEELEIRDFGRILSTDCERPRRAAMLPRLKKFTIEEPPIITSLILENFYLPATADVHILSDVLLQPEPDFGHTFAVLMPEDTRTLPILKELRKLEVKNVNNTFFLIGETPLRNKLTLEVNLDLEFLLGSMSDHVVLYESMMRNIGLVFYDSPILVASFAGDLSGVTKNTWSHALAPLTLLTELTVEDTSPDSAGTTALFDALATKEGRFTQANTPVTLCPSLDAVHVRGATYEQELLEQISHFLVERKDTQWMELCTVRPRCHGDGVIESTTLAKYQAEFGRFVQACSMDVLHDPMSV
ncbi:hypothetical protein OH77DRAFT_319512 [Trametes cingulata]|nr:hypothetical protein OH77DRAFT_319512 [Trametes cingulata]